MIPTHDGDILVVDDALGSLKMLTDMLEAQGYSVRPADSGELALVSAKADPPRLIVLDVRMPGMDGFEVFRRLAADEGTQHIPVIFIVGELDASHRLEGLRLGAVDFISRPFDRDRMMARIETHFELATLRHVVAGQEADLEAINEELRTENDQRQKAQEELARQQGLLQAIFDNLPIGVAIASAPEGRMMMVNDAATEILGRGVIPEVRLREDEASPYLDAAGLVAPGVSLSEAYHVFRAGTDEQYPSGETPMIRALAGEISRVDDMEVEQPGGRRVPLEVYGTPVRDADGEIWASLVAFVDVTDRRAAERALFESEENLNTAQHLAHLGSWTWNIKTNRLEWSDEMFNLFGIDQASFTGSLPDVIAAAIHPDDRDAVEQSNLSVMNEGKPIPVEYRVTRPDGTVRTLWAEAGELQLDDDGAPSLLRGTAQDVTERRRLEDALQQRLVALTQPPEHIEGLEFSDLFDIEDIQVIQDAFSAATGVASLITKPDGTPITRPSNFCNLCENIIRGTEKGRAKCKRSDAAIGAGTPKGVVIQPCMSGGLWDAGASIMAGSEHVGNWLIGQVRNELTDEDRLLEYADEIGADREGFAAALAQVPVMAPEKFELIAAALFSIAKELSVVAYQNVQQARFITEQQRVESEMHILNADLEARVEERTVLLDRVAGMLEALTDVVGRVAEMRDPSTAGHQRKVAELATAIGREMGMPEDDIANLKTAALLHDVGAMSVPGEVLSRPRVLTPAEFRVVQGHAKAGYDLVSATRLPHPIAEYVYQHHERCDGSGYPRGLASEELLEGSKVLMVADVVEAMMSYRPYRPALGEDAALAEIEQGAGSVYDSRVAECCLRVFRERGFAFSEESG